MPTNKRVDSGEFTGGVAVAELRVSCPTCGFGWGVAADLAGTTVKCNECGETVKVGGEVKYVASYAPAPMILAARGSLSESRRSALQDRLLRDAAFNHRVLRILIYIAAILIPTKIVIDMATKAAVEDWKRELDRSKELGDKQRSR